MINLLPSDQKEQIRYAKLNRLALVYIRTSVVVVIVLGGIFANTIFQLKQQTTAINADVADKTATIAALNKTFTPKAKDASDRLAAIKYVQGSQTRFSAVIADIAKVVPQGVSIDTMTLTGNDKVPVRITATATSYAAALAFQNALTTSPRIANADLETISANTSNFQASIVVAFKPGMAK